MSVSLLLSSLGMATVCPSLRSRPSALARSGGDCVESDHTLFLIENCPNRGTQFFKKDGASRRFPALCTQWGTCDSHSMPSGSSASELIQCARNLRSQHKDSRVRFQLAGTLQRATDLRSKAEQLRERFTALRKEYYKRRDSADRIVSRFVPTTKAHKCGDQPRNSAYSF